MFDNIFQPIFFIALVITETIRAPFRFRNKLNRRKKKIADNRVTPLEIILMILGSLGFYLFPLLYLFSSRLDFANYHLPEWAGWLGTAIQVMALWVLWKSHIDLGSNWSPSLEITEGHYLVTRGIYRVMRHPIYASVWLAAIAQVLLLQNWLAGFANLVFFIPIYFLRVPREEKMMIERFGDEYRQYMQRTGKIIPRF